MIKNVFLLFIILSMLTLCRHATSAQEDVKIVILSPRVGTLIDETERNSFQIFPQIRNFISAVVYTADGNYFIQFRLSDLDGKERDTIIIYSENLILMIAEKIDHYEEIKGGNYKIGQNPPTLVIAEGEPLRIQLPPHTKRRKTDQTQSTSDKAVFKFWYEPLPLAQTAIFEDQETYPKLGFGIGFALYSPDFSNLNNAFLAIENKYRDQGYSIGGSNTKLDITSLIYFHLQFQPFKHFSLFLQTASMDEESKKFSTTTVSLLYHVRPFQGSWFRPFAGVGIGKYTFEIVQLYGKNNRVSPITKDCYEYLDKITVGGGGTAYQIMAGVDIVIQNTIGISFYGSYVFAPKIKSSVQEYQKASPKLNGPSFGTRLSIYL